MPDVATPSSLTEELLRQRNLLVEYGRRGRLPFADPSTTAATGGTAPVTSGGSQLADAMSGQPITVIDNAGNKIPIDPNSTDTAALDNVSDDQLSAIWPLLAGAGGAALAIYLKNRLKGKPAVDPLAPMPETVTVGAKGDGTHVATSGSDPNIIEGEWTEVDPSKSGPNRLDGAKPQKALPQPAQTKVATDTNASGAPKYLSARALAERKSAGLSTPSKTGLRPITQVDEFTDVAPDELVTIRALVDRLVKERIAGQRLARPGHYNKPSLLDPETALHDVIRVLRQTKGLRSLQRAIP